MTFSAQSLQSALVTEQARGTVHRPHGLGHFLRVTSRLIIGQRRRLEDLALSARRDGAVVEERRQDPVADPAGTVLQTVTVEPEAGPRTRLTGRACMVNAEILASMRRMGVDVGRPEGLGRLAAERAAIAG